MSVRLMSAVFAASGLTSTEKLVLLAMTDFANDDGLSIYPSVETLARKTALSCRTVQNTIRALEVRGVVSVEIQGNGRYNTNEYRVYQHSLNGESTAPIETRKGESGTRKGESGTRKGERTAPDSSLTIREPILNDNDSKPNIFAIYEQTIGIITPNLVDSLKSAERDYPPEWIERAFKISAENNARNWRYVSRVLENMKAHGVDWKPSGDKRGKSTSGKLPGMAGGMRI